MIKAFTKGVMIGCQQYRIALTIYFLQFLLALPLALQVFRVLNASIGDSLEVEKLIYDYDNTIFRDFLNHHGASITPLIGQIRWILVIYFIFWIFLNGGILYSIKEGVSRWETFWTGCSRYFFRFFRVSIFYLLLHAVWAVIILGALNAILGDALNDMPTERDIVFVITGGVLIFLVGFVILLVANLVTKIKIVSEHNIKVWKAIVSGLGWTWRHLFKGAWLFMLFLLLQLLFIAIYVLADKSSGMVSEGLIFVFFFLQQFMIFARIIIRIMTAGAFWTFHNNTLPEPELIASPVD